MVKSTEKEGSGLLGGGMPSAPTAGKRVSGLLGGGMPSAPTAGKRVPLS